MKHRSRSNSRDGHSHMHDTREGSSQKRIHGATINGAPFPASVGSQSGGERYVCVPFVLRPKFGRIDARTRRLVLVAVVAAEVLNLSLYFGSRINFSTTRRNMGRSFREQISCQIVDVTKPWRATPGKGRTMNTDSMFRFHENAEFITYHSNSRLNVLNSK